VQVYCDLAGESVTSGDAVLQLGRQTAAHFALLHTMMMQDRTTLQSMIHPIPLQAVLVVTAPSCASVTRVLTCLNSM
jgi:hypothetical protein